MNAPRALVPAVLLHYRDCACGGTGWLSAPGIGPHAFDCRSARTVTVPLEEWAVLGRPMFADDLPRGYPTA